MKKIGLRMLLTSMALVGVCGGLVMATTGCGGKIQSGVIHPEYFDMVEEKYEIARNGTEASVPVSIGTWKGENESIIKISGYLSYYDDDEQEYMELVGFELGNTLNKDDDISGSFSLSKSEVELGKEYDIAFSGSAWSLETGEIISNAIFNIKVSFID